jgi:2-methylisocitrate lyase-like PEP mutase family enzyme
LRAFSIVPGLHVMPCCFDAHSARLIERAGFELTFMSGFAVSASRIGQPDTGLISYGEMLDQGRNICDAVAIPVIGDGDTGYGNAINVKRTGSGLCQSRLRLRDDRGPARAEALRPHARQGGGRARRSGDADPRRGRRARRRACRSS